MISVSSIFSLQLKLKKSYHFFKSKGNLHVAKLYIGVERRFEYSQFCDTVSPSIGLQLQGKASQEKIVGGIFYKLHCVKKVVEDNMGLFRYSWLEMLIP